MSTTINTINVGGVDKLIEDTYARERIENIISGDAPSAAEIVDARIGVDGTIHDNLGSAIRSQVSGLENALNQGVFANVLPFGSNYKSQSTKGVSFDVLSYGYRIHGTASGTIFIYLHTRDKGMVPGVIAGSKMLGDFVPFITSVNDSGYVLRNERVKFFFRCYNAAENYTDVNIPLNDSFTIPDNTVSMDAIVRIDANFNYDVSFYLGVRNAIDNGDTIILALEPLYSSEILFDYGESSFTVSSTGGNNLFLELTNKSMRYLSYAMIGARSWTVLYDTQVLVYIYETSTIQVVNYNDVGSIEGTIAILAFADSNKNMHGLWREYSNDGAYLKSKKMIDSLNSPLYNYINMANSLPETTTSINGVAFTRIGRDRLHIEGTATRSTMYNLISSFVGDLKAGEKIYLWLNQDAAHLYPSGKSYFGIRSIFQNGDVSDMVKITFTTDSQMAVTPYTIDSAAVAVQCVVYVQGDSEINGDFTFGVYKTIEPLYLNSKIEELENKIVYDQKLPDYYYENNYLPNKLLEVNNALNYENGVAFAFITDIHFPSNAYNSRLLLKEVLSKTSVPFVICGGDIPALIGDENRLQNDINDLISYMDTVGRENWYTIHGNHDLYNRTNTTPPITYSKTRQETYNIMMRTSERYVTNMLPNHACYCIDIPVQKTRIMMLNSSDQTSGVGAYTIEQLLWIIERINEIENTKFVFVSHIPSDPVLAGEEASVGAQLQEILKAFKNKTSVIINGNTYSFVNTTNTMVCHINGHMHEDLSHVDNGVLSIVSTCDAAYTEDGEGMVRGTITEQAIDVYFIDYDNQIVKTVRLGRGINRSWNY